MSAIAARSSWTPAKEHRSEDWRPRRPVGCQRLPATMGLLTRPSPRARLGPLERGQTMAWNLTGSYVETCSCELMCPCNLSFDHGATYDFCRVTLVFDIREGDVMAPTSAARRSRSSPTPRRL